MDNWYIIRYPQTGIMMMLPSIDCTEQTNKSSRKPHQVSVVNLLTATGKPHQFVVLRFKPCVASYTDESPTHITCSLHILNIGYHLLDFPYSVESICRYIFWQTMSTDRPRKPEQSNEATHSLWTKCVPRNISSTRLWFLQVVNMKPWLLWNCLGFCWSFSCKQWLIRNRMSELNANKAKCSAKESVAGFSLESKTYCIPWNNMSELLTFSGWRDDQSKAWAELSAQALFGVFLFPLLLPAN